MFDTAIVIGITSVMLLLFVSLATALSFLNFSQLQEKFKGDEYEALLKRLEKRDDVELLSKFFSVLLAIFISIFAFHSYSENLLFLLAIAGGVAFLIVLLPVVLVAPWAETVLVELMPLYNMLELIPFGTRTMKVIRQMGSYLAGESEIHSHSLELGHVLSEGEAEGNVDSAEKAMLEGVIELKSTRVREIMTPWAEVEYLNNQATVKEGVAQSSEKGLSRLPIYDSSKDQVEGVFFVRDILEKISQEKEVLNDPITKHMRQVPVVPETRSVRNLLITMSKSRNQVLLILDEYGSLAGLITLEDIMEEIVGDIRDEYVEENEEIQVLNENQAEVLGGARLDELNRVLDVSLTDGRNFESLAGYLLSRVQRIPRRGETFTFENCHFSIIAATPRRIVKVRVDRSL